MGNSKSITNKEKAFYCYFIQTIYTNLLNVFHYKVNLANMIDALGTKDNDRLEKINNSPNDFNISNIDSIEKTKRFYNKNQLEINNYYSIKKSELEELNTGLKLPHINEDLIIKIYNCRNYCAHDADYNNLADQNGGKSNSEIIYDHFANDSDEKGSDEYLERFQKFMIEMIVLFSNLENTKNLYNMADKFLSNEMSVYIRTLNLIEYTRNVSSNIEYIKLLKPKYNVRSDELIYQIMRNDNERFTDVMFYDICIKMLEEYYAGDLTLEKETDKPELEPNKFKVKDIIVALNSSNVRNRLKKNYGHLSLEFSTGISILLNKSHMIIILLLVSMHKIVENNKFELVKFINEIYVDVEKEYEELVSKQFKERHKLENLRVKLYLKIVNMLGSNKDIYYTYFNNEKDKLSNKMNSNIFDEENVNRHILEIFRIEHGNEMDVSELIKQLTNDNSKSVKCEQDALIMLDIANRLKLLDKSNKESYAWMCGQQKRKKIIGLINKMAEAQPKKIDLYQEGDRESNLNKMYRCSNGMELINLINSFKIKYLSFDCEKINVESTNDALNLVLERLYEKRNEYTFNELKILLNIKQEYNDNQDSTNKKLKKVSMKNGYIIKYLENGGQTENKNIKSIKKVYIKKVQRKIIKNRNSYKVNSSNIINMLVISTLTKLNINDIDKVDYYSNDYNQNLYFETIVLINYLLSAGNNIANKELLKLKYEDLRDGFIKRTNSDFRKNCIVIDNILTTNTYTIDLNNLNNEKTNEIVEEIKEMKYSKIVQHIETMQYILDHFEYFDKKSKNSCDFTVLYRNKVMHNQKIDLSNAKKEKQNGEVYFELKDNCKIGKISKLNLEKEYKIRLYDKDEFYNLIDV